MRVVLLLFVVACTTESVEDDQAPVTPDAQEPGGGGGEIDGTYLDVDHGVCVGGVGGAVRCAGTTCDAIENQAACAAATGCYVALQDDGSFRDCLPIDLRETTAGACATLTVRQCASREDCASVFEGVSIFAAFVRCQDE